MSKKNLANDLTQRWNRIREKPVVVADGDSWFDYPKPFSSAEDILDQLEDLGYYIEDVADHGDKLDQLADDSEQHDEFRDGLRSLDTAGKRPCAILISAGGNDFTKDGLRRLLHDRSSGNSDPVNYAAIEVAFREVEAKFDRVIQRVTNDALEIFGPPVITILLHGYAHPVPDGTPYRPWRASQHRGKGSWLRPAFEANGYESLQVNTKAMEHIVDAFNGTVSDVAAKHGHVQYVNLRDCLSNKSDYKDYWRDELHPKDVGFERIAVTFDAVIRDVLTKNGRDD